MQCREKDCKQNKGEKHSVYINAMEKNKVGSVRKVARGGESFLNRVVREGLFETEGIRMVQTEEIPVTKSVTMKRVLISSFWLKH